MSRGADVVDATKRAAFQLVRAAAAVLGLNSLIDADPSGAALARLEASVKGEQKRRAEG